LNEEKEIMGYSFSIMKNEEIASSEKERLIKLVLSH